MTDKYHDQIKNLIEENGAMGVNALQRATGINLSTLQKYLHKQSYFKQTPQRKWDLPQRVAGSSTVDFSIIENQVSTINSLMDILSAQINSTMVLMSAHKLATVEKGPTVHSKLSELDSNIKRTLDVYKKYVRVVPEEYQNLLKNLDLYALTINKGTLYVNTEFNAEISALLLEKTDTLSDSIIQTLKEYQING